MEIYEKLIIGFCFLLFIIGMIIISYQEAHLTKYQKMKRRVERIKRYYGIK